MAQWVSTPGLIVRLEPEIASGTDFLEQFVAADAAGTLHASTCNLNKQVWLARLRAT